MTNFGKARYYYKRTGCKPVALPGLPWSPDFMAAYDAAHAAYEAPLTIPLGAGQTKAGSLNAGLVRYYESTSFKELAPGTREMRRNLLERWQQPKPWHTLRSMPLRRPSYDGPPALHPQSGAGFQAHREARGAAEVATCRPRGSRRHVVHDQLLCGTAAKQGNQKALEARARLGPHCTGRTFGKPAVAADRQRPRFRGAERKVDNGMSGFVVGDAAAQVGRPLQLSSANGVEQIVQIKLAAGAARALPRHTDPLFDVGAGGSAGRECRGTKVDVRQVGAEMHTEDSRQPGDVR